MDLRACCWVIGCFSLALIVIANQPVSRTADAAAGSIQDVRVNHRGTNVLVAQEFLNRPNVVTVGQEVRRERMTKRVA